MHEQAHSGRPMKILTLIDEYTRECLALRVERRMTSEQLLETLAELFVYRGVPEHIRSDRLRFAPPDARASGHRSPGRGAGPT